MKNANQHKDVSKKYRGKAALLAASALALLLSTGTARAQDNTTGAAPADAATTQPVNPNDFTSENQIHMVAGTSKQITTRRPYKTYSTGNADVADVTGFKNSDTLILITAKKPGNTAIMIWDDQNKSQSVDVMVEPDLGTLRRQLKAAFPHVDVTVMPLNDTIALSGQVPSMQIAEQMVEMAGTFAKVHNFLEISGGQQVQLQVRFAEVSKSAVRNLGVTFGGTDGVSAFSTNGIGTGIGALTGSAPGLGIGTVAPQGGVSLFGQGKGGAIAFDYFITALRQNGLVRVLAEPTIVATSGQTSHFLAGGQVPIPVPQPGNGGSTITIEYHNYGVQLDFTPQVLGDGRIRMKVAPEVSDLDYSTAVTVAGTSVPGFTDRRVETTVELGDGQSFAIGGLLNHKTSATTTGIPLLDRIPVLGDLFSSVAYTRSETELVVLVTPRLVAGVNPDQVTDVPGEHWRSPNDLQIYLNHDLGGSVVQPGHGQADKTMSGPPPQFHGVYGFTPAGIGAAAPIDPDAGKSH